MSRVGRWITSGRRASLITFRSHPFRTVLTTCGLCAAAVLLAGYGYAVYTWRQAQDDFRAKRFSEAEQHLKFCRRVWPENPEVLLLSAKTFRQTGDLDSAEAYLNRCFAASPNSRDGAQLESLLLRVQAGDDQAVTPLFVLVDQGHPESPGILQTISVSYMKRLRYQAANASLSKWIDLYPDQALPYDFRGWIYEHTSTPALANRDYLKALELDPSLVHTRLRLVELLLAEKHVPEVAPHLKILCLQEPDRVEVSARLGMLRFLEGRNEEARQLLEDAEPKLAEADLAPVVYLARLDVQEGKGVDAERRLRKVIAFDPTETEARFVLVSALRLQSREPEAAELQVEQARLNERNIRVNQLLRDRADKPDATNDEWFEIGSLFLGMGLESRSAYWFDKVLARDPNHQASHRVLMEHYDSKGDTANAAFHRKLLR